MKKQIFAFALIALAATAIAQDQTSSFVNDKLGQRERSLAKAGGDAVKKAAQKEGAWGVGMVSSDCMESVKNGKQSPFYCLGVEAAGKSELEKIQVAPSDEKDQTARKWFAPEKQKYRIYAYCTVFLRTNDQQCGVHYANAKMAVE